MGSNRQFLEILWMPLIDRLNLIRCSEFGAARSSMIRRSFIRRDIGKDQPEVHWPRFPLDIETETTSAMIISP